MNNLGSTKTRYAYISQFVFLLFFTAFFTSITADSLSGEFFPPNSPIFANYYPNDFLPWGQLLFLGLGWIIVERFCKWFTGNRFVAVIASAIILIGGPIMWSANLQLQDIYLQNNSEGQWAYYMSRLIEAWLLEWVIGGVCSLNINAILPYFLKHTGSSQDGKYIET